MKFKISYKFIVGFLVIFTLAFIFMNYFIGKQIEKSNEELIREDLVKDKENINIYVRQFFLIKNIDINEDQLYSNGGELAEELRDTGYDEIAIFTSKGSFIYASNNQMFSNDNRGDFQNALEGKTAFSIISDGSTRVFFSFPLILNGQTIGIVSTERDYSLLYGRMENILKFIFIITAAILAVIFIFSIILSRQITVPIVYLSKASQEIAEGNFNNKVHIKSRDEIGELSTNFFNMVAVLKEQIETIKNDRDKLKELSNHRKQFFDNVTHELKTPLTTILGYAEMIRDDQNMDEKFFNKALLHIIGESRRLHNMVIKLLELSKEENIESKYEFEKVNLTEILIKTCDDMSFKAKRYNTKMNCRITEDLYTYGNSDRLKEVFINLVDNSIKYGKPGNIITAEGYKEGGFAFIDISDKGIGMSRKQLDNIFEPFYRADKKKSREIGSCGLGISIVQAILTSHKAELKFSSVLNEGTTAKLKFIEFKNLQN